MLGLLVVKYEGDLIILDIWLLLHIYHFSSISKLHEVLIGVAIALAFSMPNFLEALFNT